MIDFPCEIKAGVTLELSFSETAYPADAGWVLTIALRGPAAIDLEPEGDGAAHALTVDAETTGAWTAGVYWWEAKFTNGDEVASGGNGTTKVLADISEVEAPYDGRTDNEKARDNVLAVLRGKATTDQKSFKIKDRELVRYSVSELVALLNFIRSEIAKEKRKAAGVTGFVQVKYRF